MPNIFNWFRTKTSKPDFACVSIIHHSTNPKPDSGGQDGSLKVSAPFTGFDLTLSAKQTTPVVIVIVCAPRDVVIVVAF
jgi:hypothetical protein